MYIYIYIYAVDQVIEDMNDDFNTPRALSRLFELVNYINKFKDGHLNINELAEHTLTQMKHVIPSFVFDVLGLLPDSGEGKEDNETEKSYIQQCTAQLFEKTRQPMFGKKT